MRAHSGSWQLWALLAFCYLAAVTLGVPAHSVAIAAANSDGSVDEASVLSETSDLDGSMFVNSGVSLSTGTFSGTLTSTKSAVSSTGSLYYRVTGSSLQSQTSWPSSTMTSDKISTTVSTDSDVVATSG